MWTYKFEDVTAIQSSFFSQPNQLKNVVYHGETKEKALRTETFIELVTDAICIGLTNLMQWQHISSVILSNSMYHYVHQASKSSLSSSFFNSGECICEHINGPILQILLHKTSKWHHSWAFCVIIVRGKHIFSSWEVNKWDDLSDMHKHIETLFKPMKNHFFMYHFKKKKKPSH